MTKLLILTIIVLSVIAATAQNYTSYFTGDTSDVTTPTIGVTVLMGGATEHDSAMVWFLEHSGGGDIVVLRASGSNGYNDYMYSQLGVNVNSVQTIVCNNALASNDAYVIHQLMNAEALWFAGGDQWDYVSYWNNTPIDTAINYLINVKKIPVGGTSAGMAILGSIVNTAQNGSATSAGTLANPYVSNVTLLKDDFIFSPWLNNVITDTHYDNPDRRGRHVGFLARILQDYSLPTVYGIACNEYVSVCIDTNGLAKVYGDYPNYQEFAYFLQANCVMPNSPENCVAAEPLTWNRNAQAVKAYKVPGTNSGVNTFQLSNWNSGSGGSWQDWYVTNGTLQTNLTAIEPDCNTTLIETLSNENNLQILIFPNPANNIINVTLDDNFSIEIYDLYSKLILKEENCNNSQIDISKLKQGYYISKITNNNNVYNTRFLKI
jgi:cyanophycinase-like exopeptidase